jgi:hypothetical protein
MAAPDRALSRGVEIIYDHLIDALRELASESDQRRLWLSTGADGTDVSSLAECRCRLFDDSGLGDALDRDALVYTSAVDQELRALRVALRRIDDQRPPEAIIGDPAMDRVRTTAVAVLRRITNT